MNLLLVLELNITYLNDSHEYIGGGINLGPTNVSVLMYADNIVILADDIVTMLNQIQRCGTC